MFLDDIELLKLCAVLHFAVHAIRK